MKNLKVGVTFIILGNLLYLAKDFFGGGDPSDFESFADGLMSGLAVGTNIIGIILVFVYMANEERTKRKNIRRF